MIGEELTAVLWRLRELTERLENREHATDLMMIADRLQVVRDQAFGKLLVDPAKRAVEVERREAGVR